MKARLRQIVRVCLTFDCRELRRELGLSGRDGLNKRRPAHVARNRLTEELEKGRGNL